MPAAVTFAGFVTGLPLLLQFVERPVVENWLVRSIELPVHPDAALSAPRFGRGFTATVKDFVTVPPQLPVAVDETV